MKKIGELTELEIKTLTDDEVKLMIKLRKAEEGVRLIEKPSAPNYFPVTDPDATVYTCRLFGDALAFENLEELTAVINLIKNSTTKYRIAYDWNKAGSDYKYITKDLKEYYGDEWHTTSSSQVYSFAEYNKVVDFLTQNKKLKEQYEKDLKDYESAISEAKWIEDEINYKVLEVKQKFWKLDEFCRKFKYDYLPLSDDNEVVAMKFMNKAYSLTTEQEEYVLANYANA